MPGLLEGGPKVSFKSFQRPEVVFACLVAAAVLGAFVWAVHYVHDVATHLSLYLFPLFPIAFVMTLGLSLPLIMFVSFETDFPNVKPWRAKDFLFLCKRTFGAIEQGKIKSKNI